MRSPAQHTSNRRPHLTVVRSVAPALETTGGTLRCEIIDSTHGLDGLREEWDLLFSTSPTAAAPLAWSWVREWWRLFGRPIHRLTLVTVRRGRELIGVCPLYRELTARRRYRALFVSKSLSPECDLYPEYTDILSAPGCLETNARLIGATIQGGDLGQVDEWHLGLTRADGPLATGLAPLLGHRFSLRHRASQTAPCADLTSGFDAYLTARPKDTRQQLRRLLRSYRETPGATFNVATSTTEAEVGLLELIELHQARWRSVGQPGAFATPARVEFHRAIVRSLGPAAIVARLALDGRTLSALYGFRVGRTFEFYQSGTASATPHLKRPGIVNHLLLMEHLARAGVAQYDFLAGVSPYKLQLATTERALTEIAVRPPTPHNLLVFLGHLVRTRLRRHP